MQTRRWGRAGHCSRNRGAGAVLAVLLLGVSAAVVLPVRAQAKAERLCVPLETARYRVSGLYGWRDDPFTGEPAFHKGVDLACAEGTPVLAAGDGVVLQAKRSNGYGSFLRILHPDSTETVYAHLQYIYVRTGEVVCAGQALGTAGQSGRTTGAHLHFELREQGVARDPADRLGLSS